MKYPIGIQSFERIRKDGLVYIDKTALVYDLTHRYTNVFLGRPRRFGKSLLMSTIQAYFEGRRELFEGLAIERLESDWVQHPVLHFDLNNGNYSSADGLLSALNDQLSKYEELYGKNPYEDGPQYRLRWLIESAYKQDGIQPIVLIDEYDKPILQAMDDEKLDASIRNILKPFFGTLKTYGKYLRFVMLTGVSKFGKLSVFSDLNNVEDISLSKEFADICGLTKGEILTYFSDEIDAFAKDYEVTREQMIERLRKKYDGYRFSKAKKLVFNPYSLLNSLKSKELNDYWFETGTPTFLANLLKKNDYDLSKIDGKEIDPGSLYKVDNVTPIPLLYQTGYLTIKGYDDDLDAFILGYPNQEVEAAFINFLIPYYSNIEADDSKIEINRLRKEILSGNVEAFMRRLQSIFYSIPYANDNSMKMQEDQFRNLLYLVFKLLGVTVHTECHMSHGRSDAVVQTPEHIYVFEFKVNETADAAIAQIHNNHYAAPYLCDGRPVTLIGVNYSTAARAITDYKAV